MVDRPEGNRVFQAELYANVGQVASCSVRPITSLDNSSKGYMVGGMISLNGTADANGLVQIDGFPFQSVSRYYGIEIVSISGAGAYVVGKVAA